MSLPPLTFQPLLKERVWGGRKLEELYQKPLPPGQTIGESWEISDRAGDVSPIAEGPLIGRDLRWVMEHRARDLLGDAPAQSGRFPLLVKILDARDKLSLQVHPPASIAARLKGEPKTEMWYITDADPGAQLYAGLRRGVTRDEFETRLKIGGVADCFHRLPVGAGDALFLPSGRVHAIGAGLVIFEIQQNSDTTYRVYDWDRLGLDGRPRSLHIDEGLQSIDFEDYEPSLTSKDWEQTAFGTVRELAKDDLFTVEEWKVRQNASTSLEPGLMRLIAAASGTARVSTKEGTVTLTAGRFCLVPASAHDSVVTATGETTLLSARIGEG